MANGYKTGGRQAGTPNKLTYQTRQVLLNLLAEQYESLPELLESLEPIQRVDAICKLTKFALPAMATISASAAERMGLDAVESRLEEIEHKNQDARNYRNSIPRL